MNTEEIYNDDNNKTPIVNGNINVSSEELGNDGACTNSEGSSPKKEFTALCSINTLSSCESIPRKNSIKNDDNEKNEEECSIEEKYSDNDNDDVDSCNISSNNINNNNVNHINCDNNNNNKHTTNKQSDTFTFKNTDKNTNKQSIHELKHTLLKQASKDMELYTNNFDTENNNNNNDMYTNINIHPKKLVFETTTTTKDKQSLHKENNNNNHHHTTTTQTSCNNSNNNPKYSTIKNTVCSYISTKPSSSFINKNYNTFTRNNVLLNNSTYAKSNYSSILKYQHQFPSFQHSSAFTSSRTSNYVEKTYNIINTEPSLSVNKDVYSYHPETTRVICELCKPLPTSQTTKTVMNEFRKRISRPLISSNSNRLLTEPKEDYDGSYLYYIYSEKELHDKINNLHNKTSLSDYNYPYKQSIIKHMEENKKKQILGMNNKSNNYNNNSSGLNYYTDLYDKYTKSNNNIKYVPSKYVQLRSLHTYNDNVNVNVNEQRKQYNNISSTTNNKEQTYHQTFKTFKYKPALYKSRTSKL